jgi:hypothetical protein
MVSIHHEDFPRVETYESMNIVEPNPNALINIDQSNSLDIPPVLYESTFDDLFIIDQLLGTDSEAPADNEEERITDQAQRISNIVELADTTNDVLNFSLLDENVFSYSKLNDNVFNVINPEQKNNDIAAVVDERQFDDDFWLDDLFMDDNQSDHNRDVPDSQPLQMWYVPCI